MRIRTLLFTALVAGWAFPALAQTPAILDALSGTYRTRLVYEDLAAQGFHQPYDLVGTWTVSIRPDGHVEWHYDLPSGPGPSSYDMSSVYVVHGDRLYVGADTGAYPCQDLYGVTSGVYAWSWTDDEALDLTVIDDACPERRIILTAKPLVPVDEAPASD